MACKPRSSTSKSSTSKSSTSKDSTSEGCTSEGCTSEVSTPKVSTPKVSTSGSSCLGASTSWRVSERSSRSGSSNVAFAATNSGNTVAVAFPSPHKYLFKQGDVIYRYLEHPGGTLAGYNHYGVYVGNGEVIVFIQNTDGRGEVRNIPLELFGREEDICVQTDFSPYNHLRRSSSATKAEAVEIHYTDDVYWRTYDVFSRNCEHFSSYCALGIEHAKQSIFLKRDTD